MSDDLRGRCEALLHSLEHYHDFYNVNPNDLDMMLAFARSLVGTWTDQKPTKPGWYWYRHPKWETVEPVIVKCVVMPKTEKLTILWAATNQSVSDYVGPGQWAGPIAEPEGEP